MQTTLLQKIRAILNEDISEGEKVKNIQVFLNSKDVNLSFDSIENVLKETFDIIEKKKGSENLTYYQTGFEDLDQLMNGVIPGELVVVGGRPAMGKTAFCISLALNMSKKYPLLYFSLEAPKELLIQRMLAAKSSIDYSNIINGKFEDQEWEKLNQAKKELESIHDIFICDSNINKVYSLDEIIQETAVLENGVKIVIIDYIQLFNTNSPKYRDFDLGYICKRLKQIAKDNNIIIFVVSQLNRNVETRYRYDGRKPLLSDLRDSGSLEQESDKVLFIHRPEYYNIVEDHLRNSLLGIGEIIIAKNRNGATGEVQLKFVPSLCRFDSIDFTPEEFKIRKDRLIELGLHSECPF